MIKVYVKTDSEGNITAVNSGIFIRDASAWTEIDEGEGDRYAHAQSGYLPKPLTDEYGRFNYRLSNGCAVEIPEADKPEADVSVLSTPYSELEQQVTDIQLAMCEIFEMMGGGA